MTSHIDLSSPPRALILMANNGQDPTESAVSWKKLVDAGFTVEFATEKGAVAEADQKLVIKSFFRTVLGPQVQYTEIYHEMTRSKEFQNPHSWEKEGFSLLPYDCVILPGGHDKPIKQYLESPSLHTLVAQYWPLTVRLNPLPHSPPGYTAPTQLPNASPSRTVGAICHGVLVLAFTSPSDATTPPDQQKPTSPENSLLADVESTTLPQWLEGLGQGIATLWGMGQYYRTYTGRWTYEDVVAAAQSDKGGSYQRGPVGKMGSWTHTDPRRHYVSARWPGDTEEFAQKIIDEVRACREEYQKGLASAGQ